MLKPRQLIAVLERLGFVEVRQRLTQQFRHSDGRVTTVPDHRGRDISPSLLRKILDDIRVEPTDFANLL